MKLEVVEKLDGTIAGRVWRRGDEHRFLQRIELEENHEGL